MNIPKIIEALNKAKADDLRFGKGMYYNEIQNAYCTVGGLAHASGVSNATLMLANPAGNEVVDIAAISAEDHVRSVMRGYDLDVDDLQLIIGESDRNWNSWDDAIQHFEGMFYAV